MTKRILQTLVLILTVTALVLIALPGAAKPGDGKGKPADDPNFTMTITIPADDGLYTFTATGPAVDGTMCAGGTERSRADLSKGKLHLYLLFDCTDGRNFSLKLAGKGGGPDFGWILYDLSWMPGHVQTSGKGTTVAGTYVLAGTL